MKKIILASIILLMGAYACTPKARNRQSQAIVASDSLENSSEEIEILQMADNSENSLDWDGVYLGIVPCADCEGIKTEITLNKDRTYKITTQYLGKQDAVAYTQSGTFTWSADGSRITLLDIKDAPSQYIVGENVLIQLDMEGNRIESLFAEQYELRKISDDEI